MNKTELIAEVAKKCAMSKKDAEKAVSATFDSMGRNPKTKEPIEIPATTVPVFKPGKALKDQISK